MSRYKNGNPKKQSRFICLHCLKENMIGTGLQRLDRQREKGHVKSLYCLNCRSITYNQEVRYCDNYDELYIHAKQIRNNYYLEDHILNQ